MKQHITTKQLNKLSEKDLGKLVDWATDNDIECFSIAEPGAPLLSIGQMIEFLDEKQEYQFQIFRRTLDWKVIVNDLQYGKKIPGELCDFLWEAVKEILEK